MSVENVKAAIKEFLASPLPEVLCIRGAWGTGKTFNWKEIARAQRDVPNGVSLNEYAYVSLFGLNSIAELKAQIVQSTVVRSQIGDMTDFSTFNKAISSIEQSSKKGLLNIAKGLLGSRADTVVSALGLFTRKQIICIDDLERKGSKLSSTDVLGFISYLKEDRRCKVALLLNDEALEGADREQFAAYLEKVVDRNLLFAPSPEESAEIAITEVGDLADLVKQRCKQLKIDNIRVIRKIFETAKQVAPLLGQYKVDVLRNVITSVVLFGWMNHQPELAPDVEFLQRHSRTSLSTDQNELSPGEMRWAVILDGYGFTHVDDLDTALMKAVARGYFAVDEISPYAQDLHRRILKQEALERFRGAWAQFHYSFSSDERVIANIVACAEKDAAYISIENLHGVVSLLRRFGMHDLATAVIDAFIDANKETDGAFDTSRVFLRDENLDEEIERRLVDAGRASKTPRQVDQFFLNLNEQAFADETVLTLANTPVEEYVRVFKTYDGDDLRTILSGVFQYGRIGNASNDMKEIVTKSRKALTVIGQESKLNAERVKGWGISVPAIGTEEK